jgi:hypothetical protein
MHGEKNANHQHGVKLMQPGKLSAGTVRQFDGLLVPAKAAGNDSKSHFDICGSEHHAL